MESNILLLLTTITSLFKRTNNAQQYRSWLLNFVKEVTLHVNCI